MRRKLSSEDLSGAELLLGVGVGVGVGDGEMAEAVAGTIIELVDGVVLVTHSIKGINVER